MNPLTLVWDSKVSKQGVYVEYFKFIPLLQFPISRIKSVRLMGNWDLIAEDLRHFRFFALRAGNRFGSKVFVVEADSFLFKWLYLTPKDPLEAYNILSKKVDELRSSKNLQQQIQ